MQGFVAKSLKINIKPVFYFIKAKVCNVTLKLLKISSIKCQIRPDWHLLGYSASLQQCRVQSSI